MIEFCVKRSECRLDIGEVEYPTRQRVNLSGYVNLDSKRVPVKPGALVPLWNVRQTMCRLEDKLFEDIHTLEMIQEDVLAQDNYTRLIPGGV